MSNNFGRFSILVNHYFWCGPLQLVIVTVLLYQRIGPSSLVVSFISFNSIKRKSHYCVGLISHKNSCDFYQGIVMLVMAVPLQIWIGKQFGKLRERTAEKTDHRIGLMSEIVNGMKVIKMNTWENSFANLVHQSRGEEIREIRNSSNYLAFNSCFFIFTTRILLLCTFIAFAFTGEVK